MIFGILFAAVRLLQILTLIPIFGMLAYFVHIYTIFNLLAPVWILLPFIVAIIATFWAIVTLFTYHRTRTNALFVSGVDILFVGAFIAADYYLSFIAYIPCGNITGDPYWGISVAGVLVVELVSICNLLKASFALCIINTILFFWSFLLACCVGRRDERRRVTYVTRETHVSRHGHRRSGSHRSHRSHHSHSSRRSGSGSRRSTTRSVRRAYV